MNSTEDSEVWRLCEVAWSNWLQSSGHAVFHSNEAEGNSSGTRAPLITIAGARRRAPDLQATKEGLSEYWEVKYRSRADFDALTGERIFWAQLPVIRDYAAIAEGTGCRVWVVVFEGPRPSSSSGRWFQCDVLEILKRGRRGTRIGRDGKNVEAWIWPASAMDVVDGPQVKARNISRGHEMADATYSTTGSALYSEDGRIKNNMTPNVSLSNMFDAECTFALPVSPRGDRAGLKELCGLLGMSVVPQYSVVRCGLDGLDIDLLFELLHFGIKIYLITESNSETAFDPVELHAFRESRLLEWAVVGSAYDRAADGWIVDGNLSRSSSSQRTVLKAADESGGINLGQYKIIHASTDSDLMVTAGAGTGKTETMAERIVFLLSTTGGTDGAEGTGWDRASDLRVDDIVLVTFTRDAAREMRKRISRTLMLRQRLCRRIVLPVMAWMMQLGAAQITTIHGYAKYVLRSTGGTIGLTPEMRVALQTLVLRKIFHDLLSPHLAGLIERYPKKNIPASHLWEDHLEAIWEALGNNGVSAPVGTELDAPLAVQWGGTESDDLNGAIQETIRIVLSAAAVEFRKYCLQNQAVRLSDLVPFALAALTRDNAPRVRRPRYFFIDEFQDTDAQQMEFVLMIRKILDGRLFVVGDAKQGVYRFRGAEGNAFSELERRTAHHGLSPFVPFSLSRNYRSGCRLIESLDPYFSKWNDLQLLNYGALDKLVASTRTLDVSRKLGIVRVNYVDIVATSARQIATWRNENPKQSIAILCRSNRQAEVIREAVLAKGVACDLVVGGSFYRSPAVRELAVLLQSAMNPEDDASLLQLCETRWATRLFGTAFTSSSSSGSDGVAASLIMGWGDRFTSLASGDSYARADLEVLRGRLRSTTSLLSRMSVIAWIVECARAFTPEVAMLASDVDDSERTRYSRCLDHLITLLDENFKDGPISLPRLLAWLQLQIATNHAEDEPLERSELEGKTFAMTVHKAKGLEFDRVLVPHTWQKFEAPNTDTRVSILRRDNDLPRLIWEWKAPRAGTYSNVSPKDWLQTWRLDDVESTREETRLLYVALTRAKVQVDVYVRRGRKARGAASSWADLILEAIDG